MKLRFLFIAVLILVGLSCFSNASITAYPDDSNPSVFEQSNRTLEISQSSIDLGKAMDLKNGDLIKLMIWYKSYPIYVNEISNGEVKLLTFGNQTISLKQDELKILEITNRDTNNKKILMITLNSIKGKTAQIYIKTYEENIAVKADYKELFDIEVELPSGEIYEGSDLTVYIKFFNFGEGPSHINIEYAVADDSKKEYYRGIDDKIVYTEDSIIKNFDFLKLKPGNYTITSEISYGKNQTALSEKNFRILPVSSFSRLRSFLILAGVIVVFLLALYPIKSHLKRRNDDKAQTLNALRKNLT